MHPLDPHPIEKVHCIPDWLHMGLMGIYIIARHVLLISVFAAIGLKRLGAQDFLSSPARIPIAQLPIAEARLLSRLFALAVQEIHMELVPRAVAACLKPRMT